MKIIIALLACFLIQITPIYANQNVFYERVASVCPMGQEWSNWITDMILLSCKENDVDPFLAIALFETESHFDMSAYSNTGAIGITQLMPETAASLGVDPYDAQQNIEGGVKYLSYQLKQFAWAGEMQNTYAIAAYNAGPNAVFEYGTVPPYDETYNHVTKIALIYQELLDAYT